MHIGKHLEFTCEGNKFYTKMKNKEVAILVYSPWAKISLAEPAELQALM
jgi:hypothetical protein